MAGDRPVGEPQLARVVLDDFEQREAEPRAGVRVGALPHGRAARERARPSAPRPRRWIPCPGKRSAVGGRVDHGLAERDVHPARPHAHLHDTRRPPVTATRVASRSSGAPSATGARKLTRHSRRRVASPSQSASTTNADARAAVHAPCTIGRRSPAIRAARTERCSGLRSPPTRANASIDAGATSSAARAPPPAARGARARAPQESEHGRGDVRGGVSGAISPDLRVPARVDRARSRSSAARRRAARRASSRPARAATSPAAPARTASHGCAARKSASPASAASARRRGVVAAQLELRRGRRRRGSRARPRRRRPRRARSRRGRGSAAASARRPGGSSTSQADAAPDLARQRRPGRPGVTAWVACTSSWKRAASSGVASSEQTAGQASVQARSSGHAVVRGAGRGAVGARELGRAGPAVARVERRRSRRPRGPRRRRPRRRRRRGPRSAAPSAPAVTSTSSPSVR